MCVYIYNYIYILYYTVYVYIHYILPKILDCWWLLFMIPFPQWRPWSEKRRSSTRLTQLSISQHYVFAFLLPRSFRILDVLDVLQMTGQIGAWGWSSRRPWEAAAVGWTQWWFWCENGPAMIFSFFESFWILHSLDSLAWCDDSLLGIGLHVNEAEAGESGPWASCWKGRVGRGSEQSEQLESMGKPQMLQIA